MKVPVQPVAVGEPGEQGGTECVAGADRIDHINGGSRCVDLRAGAEGKRAFGPKRHDDKRGAASKEGPRRGLKVELWIKPGDVGIARLDDRALGKDAVEPGSIG